MENPLLEVKTQVPFAQVKAEHVTEAIPRLLREAQARIDAIAAQTEYGYEATLGALERATETLDYAMSVASHLEAVSATPEFRNAFNAVQPEVASFYSGIPLNAGLYRALTAFAATDEAKALDAPRARFLANTLADFRRNGAALPEEGKKRAEAIDVKLTELTLKFAQNVVDASSGFELLVADEAALAGLPKSAIRAARTSAEEKGKEGYRLTLDAPCYGPALTYLDDRALRERMYRAHATRAATDLTGTAGAGDNRPLLAHILDLRREKAALLGFATFADLVLENRMAKSGTTAREFVTRVRAHVDAAFRRENEELAAFAKETAGVTEILPWDVAYFAEKRRKALYEFDEESLRPYFELGNVVRGVFEVTQRLYGLTFERKDDPVSVWHPSVEQYRVKDATGTDIGSFFLDLFPREGKRDGAWMHGVLDRIPGDPAMTESVGLIVGNMTKPQDGKSLLTHREVQTVFHEFGHLLHHLLSTVEVRSLAGTKVAWDFVELPSQIMENFCWDEATLALFAHHHETGEALPKELFERLKRARGYRAANALVRQLGFSTMDLELHTTFDPSKHGGVVPRARAIMQEFSPAPLPDDYAMIASFLHLFSSPVGYAAGYYSYQWAEVLDADAYAMFAEHGGLSREVGEKFRSVILARGDSEDPAILFRTFRGRDPDETAALRRVGLA